MNSKVVVGCLIAAVAIITSPVRGDTLCLGESDITNIDLACGTRAATTTEQIRYCSEWGDGAPASAYAAVSINGEILKTVTGSGSIEWTATGYGTYTLTHQVMSGGTQYGETLVATFYVKGDICSSESAAVKVDLMPSTRMTASSEVIRYSTEWVDTAPSGAESVIDVNGNQLNSAAGTGFVDWTPMSNGTYTLTHKVVLGETQYGEILTATFLVTELPDAYSETQTTEIPVPYVWLSQYDPDIANTYDSYEAAAMAVAANGLKVWECYLAGLDPTNATSTFTASIAISNGVPWVTWSPNLNTNGIVRNYTILGKTNLTDTADWAPTNSAHRFFKVKVELP